MTTTELSEILDKKPENISDKDVLNSLVNRGFEIEGYNSEISLAETVNNILPSASKAVKDTYYAFRHLPETAKALKTVGSAVGEKIGSVFGKEMSEESQAIISQLSRDFSDRYGTIERIKNTIEKDPVGFISDISLVAGGGGAALKGIGKVAGLASKSSKVAKASRILQKLGNAGIKTGNILEPSILVTDVMAPATKAVVRKSAQQFLKTGMGKWIDEHALSASFKSTKLGEKASNVNEIFKESWSKTAARFGIHGHIKDMRKQTKILGDSSKKAVDDAFGSIKTRYRDADDIHKALDVVDEVFDSGKVSSAQLNDAKGWVRQLRTKHMNEGLNLTEINDLKRAYDDFIDPYSNQAKVSGVATVSFEPNSLIGKDKKFILDNLRNFIDDKAKAHKFNDYRKLNNQTRWSAQSNSLLKNIEWTFADKINLVDQWLVGSAAAGAAATMATSNLAFLAAAAGVGLTRIHMKSPKFATGVANSITRLKGDQFVEIAKVVQAGKHTSKSKAITRRIFKELQPAFPGIRVSGIVAQKVKQQELDRQSQTQEGVSQ